MDGPRTVVGAVLVRDGAVLAARRSTPPVGLWEFPGGKVEPRETPPEALVRELREELGLEVVVGEELSDHGRAWPISSSLELRLFLVTTDGSPQPGDSHDEVRWLGPDALASVTWLPSDRLAVAALRRLLDGSSQSGGQRAEQ